MKKSLLILGLVATTGLNASTHINDSIRHIDLPINTEQITFKTEMVKAKFLSVQLKDIKHKNFEKSIKLLKELTPILSKMEKNIRKK